MRQSTKITQGNICEEQYEEKKYLREMKPSFARVRYRERYFMLKYCKLNFPSDPENRKSGFKCTFCSSISSQNHLIYTCPEYEHLRRDKNLLEETDRVRFLVDVIKYRQEQDEVHVDRQLVES